MYKTPVHITVKKDTVSLDFSGELTLYNLTQAQTLIETNKLATFEKGSRNYKKYTKILRKHIKNNNMRNRINSDINSIEQIKKLSGY